MLTAALLFLFNMARGEGKISHNAWLLLAAWLIIAENGLTFDALLWLMIVVIITIRGTGPTLLIGINGDKRAIIEGLKRNCWVNPALAYLHSWIGLILLTQGFWYWMCGKYVTGGKATRTAEGITGVVLGSLIAM